MSTTPANLQLSASMYKRTPLRISTMVATAHFGTTLNLNQLFTDITPILIPLWYADQGILKFEHRDQVVGESHRDALTKRRISKDSFFNQSTLVVRRSVPAGGWKEVNLKLFANGGVQMTGIISEEFARETLTWIIAELGRLERSPFAEPAVVQRFNVQLVNSDYSVGCSLRRDRLHEILTTQYGIFSLFESTIYQGVNTKYYHNVKGDTTRPGQCACKTICKGQGTGDGEGQCKRITMSIFQTGNIIITGARNMEQIMIAYEFLNKVLDKHAGEIIRAAAVPAAAAVKAPAKAAAKTKTKAPAALTA